MIRFAICLYACCCVFSVASAEDLRWTYTPAAAYVGDHVTVSFETADNASVRIADKAVSLTTSSPGVWQARFLMKADFAWSIAVNGTTYPIFCLASSAQGVLQMNPDTQRLQTKDGMRVILAAQRFQRHKDRRYTFLRPFAQHPQPDIDVFWPKQAPYGASPLIESLPVWQQRWLDLEPNIAPLFVIDVREELKSWNPGEFSAILSWIFAQQKSGRPLFILQPPSDPFRFDALAGVRKAIHEASRDAAARVMDFAELNNQDYWAISDGVIGQWLNESGRNRLNELLVKQFTGTWEVPPQGWIVE